MSNVHKFPPIAGYEDTSWSLPNFTSNTTYGTITSSYFGSNSYKLFNTSARLYGGYNADHWVDFYFTAPDLLKIVSFTHNGDTISNSSYSALEVQVQGYNMDTGAYVAMGSRSYGESFYGGTNTVSLTPMISNQFKIRVHFRARANMPNASNINYVRLNGYKHEYFTKEQLDTTNPKLIFYKSDDSYLGLLKDQ